jgi:hypothetical protein|uniref:Thoeris anti-defense 2-like domain-containing protein n=1 Tax=Myoviridae sp. ctshb19 TaxID=2825194 RepID=A0A8S5UFW4_9CAUD|nr:MAG TPA: Protein of unknown function (DUF2829) [Myoviridae sp. ctshb19]
MNTLHEQLAKEFQAKGYTLHEAFEHHSVRYIDKNGKAKAAFQFDVKLFGFISPVAHDFQFDFVRFVHQVSQGMEQRGHDTIYLDPTAHPIHENGFDGFLLRMYSLDSKDQKTYDSELVCYSKALAAIKEGRSVRRAGWNGKNQHVYLENFDGMKYEPCFILFNAQEKYQPGWVPSMGDLMAEDWEILPE